MPSRYYYCGFCHIYYAGRDDDLHVVESPYKDYNVPTNIVEDPLPEENNEES